MELAMDRRDFLQLSSLLLADLALGGPVSCTSVESLPDTAVSNGSKGRVVIGFNPMSHGRSQLRILDWDTMRFQDFEVPFNVVHAFARDPLKPSRLLGLELFGDVTSFDLETGAFAKVSDSEKKTMCNGHGAYVRSGDLFVCTQIGAENVASVAVRKTKDLSLVSFLPKECNGAHQVAALPNSKTMVVGNLTGLDGKLSGGITFFDEETRKVLNRVDLEYPVIHVLPLSSTEVIGVTLPDPPPGVRTSALEKEYDSTARVSQFAKKTSQKPGPLYYANVDGTTKTFWGHLDKAQLKGSFGLANVSKGRFLSGHVTSDRVILWNDSTIEHVFDVPHPLNIVASKDGKEFLVISSGYLRRYSLETRELLQTYSDWPKAVTLSAYA